MKEDKSPTTAALYARVSSDRQEVDLSVAAQLRALKVYAEKNGYHVAREYIDEAESGLIADQPQFSKMMTRPASRLPPSRRYWSGSSSGSLASRSTPSPSSRC